MLLGGIEAAERAVERAEIAEIEAIAKAFPEIPEPIFDAVRYRAERLTAQSLNVDTASNGSIILAGAAAAVAYWLLDKTLGKTLEKAWLASDLQSRVEDFLTKRRGQKAQQIANSIRVSRWPNAAEQVEVKTELKDQILLIVVVIPIPLELTPIPSASQMKKPKQPGDA